MKFLVLVLCLINVCSGDSINTRASCPVICPANYNPVCGSDGKSYSNTCELNSATCRDPSITLSHTGSCSSSGSGSGSLTKPCQSVMCITLWDPVCGSDGVTYSNTCRLHAANCGNHHVTLASRGACGSTSIG